MKSCKISWFLVAILSVIVAVFAYKFYGGTTKTTNDGRLAIMLSKNERNALLQEMRDWLKNSQGIMAAAIANDFETVEKIAKATGMAAEDGAEVGAILLKLPLEIKTLGFATRRQFDEIAVDAIKLKDTTHTVRQLSTAMNNCVACHATFSFADEAK